MDAMRDQDDFYGLLDQLSVTWTGFPAKDEMRQAYWGALRDARLSEVRANVERILRTATGRQPFPKPAELRDEPPKLAPPAQQAAFQEAEDRSIRHLEQLRQRDPAAWEKLIRAARIAQGKDPDCNAIRFHRQFRGNVVYDMHERCWKRP